MKTFNSRLYSINTTCKSFSLIVFFIILNSLLAHSQPACLQKAVQFDGVDDFVDMGTCSGLTATGALTIEAWIFPTGIGKAGLYGGVGGMIINKEGEYEISMSPTGLQFAIANDLPGWAWTETNYMPSLNVWTHIALTYDYSSVSGGGMIRMYANAVLVYEFLGNGLIEDEYKGAAIGNLLLDEFNVGSRQNGFSGTFFEGAIDEVRIWKTALSQAQIQAWHNSTVIPSHPQYANIIGYWKFNEGIGLVAADALGKNNGTLLGSVLIYAPTYPGNPHPGEITPPTWTSGAPFQTTACGGVIPQLSCVAVAPVTIICPANLTVSCNASVLPEVTGSATALSDNIIPPALTYNDVISPGSCSSTYSIARTWTATNNVGGLSNCVQTITVTDNIAPLITTQVGTLNKTLQCSNSTGITSALALVPTASDNCTTTLTRILASDNTVVTPGCASGYVRTRVWKFQDGCNNTSADFTQVITVIDNTAPTFTVPADKKIPYATIAGGYTATPAVTGDVTNEADNCSTGLQANYTDAVTPCGNDIVITRTWKLVDKCGNATTKVQTITATDNTTSYIIYAKTEAKFAELTAVIGSVGVTDALGKADFKCFNYLPSPYFVKAKYITVANPSSVANRILQPANDGPNPAFYSFAGTTSSLPAYTVSASTTVPLTGNYKTLTIKKNVRVTLKGTLYGTIIIEDKAEVTFNPTGNILNIENLYVKGELKTTKVIFTNPTSVRIKNKVDILNNCKINVGGPRVIFYFNDDGQDIDKLTVHGKCTWVNVNVYMKSGRIRVYDCDDYNPTIMTGWFIATRVLSEAKSVLWAAYNTCCDQEIFSRRTDPAIVNEVNTTAVPVTENTIPVQDEMTVRLYPNPSTTDFRIEIKSNSTTPVNIKLTNSSGSVVGILTISLQKQPVITVGKEWRGGTYFAEVVQGNNRKILKLVKIN